MELSGIEWTNNTFNPWLGCRKVSEACRSCYAQATALQNGLVSNWHSDRQRTSESYWQGPYAWDREARETGRRIRVFCASMADVFDDAKAIQPHWRTDLWKLISDTPNLDWQLLTKRPQNITKFVPTEWIKNGFPKQVWVGVTAEDQRCANERIPMLLSIPAVVRFISVEPLLGDLDLSAWLTPAGLEDHLRIKGPEDGLQWVITGGESGQRARPSHPAWLRHIHRDCRRTGTPVFFKQWGAYLGVDVIDDGHGHPIHVVPEHFGGARRTFLAKGEHGAFSHITCAPALHPDYRIGAALAIHGTVDETGHEIDGHTLRAFPLTPFSISITVSTP